MSELEFEGYCDECCNLGIIPCMCGGDFCVCGNPEPTCWCCGDGMPCHCYDAKKKEKPVSLKCSVCGKTSLSEYGAMMHGYNPRFCAAYLESLKPVPVEELRLITE